MQFTDRQKIAFARKAIEVGVSAVAQECGRSHSTVNRWIRSYGLRPVRPPQIDASDVSGHIGAATAPRRMSTAVDGFAVECKYYELYYSKVTSTWRNLDQSADSIPENVTIELDDDASEAIAIGDLLYFHTSRPGAYLIGSVGNVVHSKLLVRKLSGDFLRPFAEVDVDLVGTYIARIGNVDHFFTPILEIAPQPGDECFPIPEEHQLAFVEVFGECGINA